MAGAHLPHARDPGSADRLGQREPDHLPRRGERPRRGGAVIAINHTSYVDWLPAALAMHRRHRRMRFMIKAEMQQVKVVNFLIKHTKTIPVDRGAGADAYAVAVQRLREGEVVGVYPEATISRSFELKEFKTGAARMATRSRCPDRPGDRLGHAADLDQGPPKKSRSQQGAGHRRGGGAVARSRRHRDDRCRAARIDDHAAAPGAAAVSASGRGVLGASPAGRQRADVGRGGPDGRRRALRPRP